ncbi:MAG: dienelactone hydrolase family protein, partial [Actinomycetota bacterium]
MIVGLAPLDLDRPPRFSVARRLVALLGLAAVIAAWVQTGAATSDLGFEQQRVEGVPIEVLVPDAMTAPAPGVVVVHGLAGSGRLMRSTATALAAEGYVVAVPDLAGHGANRSPLPGDDEMAVLSAEVGVALDVLADRDDVDPERLGVLGHSMGAG